MSTNQLNDTGKMFDALNEIMKQFDIDEIREEPKGIKKIFCNIKKQLDKIISKYDNLSKEIDKVYIQLKEYESEIYLKIITGKVNIIYFDEFVEQWNERGGEQITKEVQEKVKD